MFKRKYPYDIDSCAQLKMHIGDKQVANGVLAPTKMPEIYERTNQLLFQRARASFETIVHPVLVEKMPCDSKAFKQLQLNFDGKIVNPDPSVKNLNMCIANQQKCSFCSKTSKLDNCGKCGDMFCNMCSFSMCSNEINNICLTCYE